TLNGLVEETAFGFIADDSSKGNKICGFSTGVIRKEPDGEETAWIHLTGVHPEYRHHKIGSRLAEAFFEYCLQKSLKSVHINVNWGDASMLTWLGTLGFGMSLGKLVEFERTL
ncbi:MAG: GNAT family N-acetyltransferase, partial [Chloroflexi bacterium]|nr:GNAT family N-acetyltransferase [Chloroflexota bacterium]